MELKRNVIMTPRTPRTKRSGFHDAEIVKALDKVRQGRPCRSATARVFSATTASAFVPKSHFRGGEFIDAVGFWA